MLMYLVCLGDLWSNYMDFLMPDILDSRVTDGQYNANIYDIHLFSILFCRLTGMLENMIPHCLI